MKNRIPAEFEEAIQFAAWLRLNGYSFTHVANESGQEGDKKVNILMSKKKQMGVSRGFPDYIIILKRGSLLFLELKRRNKSISRISKEQQQWIDKLSAINNVGGGFAYGCEEAIKVVQDLENY